jgi:VWFA-related protein
MNYAVSRRDLIRWAGALVPATRLFGWQDAKQAEGKQADTRPDEAKQSDPKYAGGVSVVNVFVTVRDKQGKIDDNLNQGDFSLDEDGHPQTIKYFSKQTDLPLRLGLLVDTSLSERREIEPERRASRIFIDQVLREDKDKAFLIHFDHEVELLQDITSSKKDLDAALNDLQIGQPQLNRRNSGQTGGQTGGGGTYPQQGQGRRGGNGGAGAGGTALYDAIYLAANEEIKKEDGRKALVLLSDGVDNGSKVSLTTAIEAAQRTDALIYSIRFYDTESQFGQPGGFGGRGRRGGLGGGPFPGGGGGGAQRSREDGKKILQQIASETGGGYFEVSSKMTLDKIYDRIQEDLRNQYSLGYTSDQATSGYRKIHVTVKPKNLTVQAREGYYPR